VNCFDPATCGDKTGNDDWDFLVLDQIWLPQLCRALEEGHDPTLTHMSNARCQSNAARRSGLSIHGLWPNYINGFPQCCKHIALPEKLASDLAAQAEDKWVDPTEAVGDKCGVCSMWAHEMMKHGTCLTTNMTNYMQVTFALLTRLTQQTSAANALLTTASHTRVPTEALKQVFSPFVVQMLCDGKDERSTNSTGVFLELRTCWNRTEHFSPDSATASSLFQIDCPGKPVGDSCPEFIIAPEFDSYQMV
jgi:ribonuclease T2